jgi:hypothetical protein
MDGPQSLEPHGSGESPPSQLREILDDAIRYRGARRLAYNLVLTAVVIASVASTWPHFRGALTLESLLALVILATLANVCYCAAYVVDIPMQYSSFFGVAPPAVAALGCGDAVRSCARELLDCGRDLSECPLTP